MNTMILSLLILCYSLVLGIIFAQVLLTAPVVFKVLDNQNASNFLRKIFPRYYLLILKYLEEKKQNQAHILLILQL